MLSTLRLVVARQIAKLFALSLITAFALHFARPLVWLPFSLLAAIGLHYLMSLFYNRQANQPPNFTRRRNYLSLLQDDDANRRHTSAPMHPPPPSPPPQISKSAANIRWRQNVQSSVVEHAWDTLCGSIVQEFIYDSWFAMLSPDREFPSEIRRLLNHAFGTLSLRARHLDLRIVLEDACELFMETIELYRDTRDSVMVQRPDYAQLPQEAKDELLRREMAAEGNLHPALTSPDGHYKVLQTISDGTVGILLANEPSQAGKNAAIRAVSRELFAGCVLRPLLMYCTPYYANKAMIVLLTEQFKSTGQQQQAAAAASNANATSAKQTFRNQQQQQAENAGGAAVHNNAMMDEEKAMRGQWEFEQRILSSAQAEKTPPSSHLHTTSGGGSKRVVWHSKSKSVDNAFLLRHPTIDEDINDGDGDGNDNNNGTTASNITRGISIGQNNSAIPSPATARTTSTSPQEAKSEDSNDTESEASSPLPHHQSSSGGASQRKMSPFEEESEGSSIGEKNKAGGGGGGGGGLRSHAVPALQLDTMTSSGPRDESDTHLIAPSVVNSTRIIDSSRSLTSNIANTAAAIAAKYAQQQQQQQQQHSYNGGGVGDDHAMNNGGRVGFTGRPRARVVAAELHTSAFKDFVVYKIRVGDDSMEWTISRRYRHFEVLHRQLLVYSAYKLKLPPKRIFFHAQTVDFVEERREALDKYLQQLLSSRQLAACSDIYEFLRKGSEVYELPRAAVAAAAAATPSPGPPIINKNPSVNTVDHELTPPDAVVPLGSATLMDAPSSQQTYMLSARGRRQSRSVPSGLNTLDATTTDTSTGTGLGRFVVGPLSKAATKSARKLKTVLSISTSTQNNNDDTTTNGGGGGGGAESTVSLAASEEDTSVSNGTFTQNTAISRSSKDEAVNGDGGGEIGKTMTNLQVDSTINAIKSDINNPALKPSPSKLSLFSRKSRPKSASTSRTSSPVRRRNTYPVEPSAGEGGVNFQQQQLQGGNGMLPIAAVPSKPPHNNNNNNNNNMASKVSIKSFPPSSLAATAPSLDPDDCTGISAPLYEIVDCIFQLQRRGFFRRQVFGIGRQVLSLVAGDVIDVFLLNKLRLLRQEHTIARLIHKLQNSLWPGGVWYSYVATAARAASASASGGGGTTLGNSEKVETRTSLDQQSSLHSSTNNIEAAAAAKEGPLLPPPSLMQSDRYLNPSGPPPPDAEYVEATIKELMLNKMASSLPLARLVGKGVYNEGMSDLHDMMMSEVFMHQLGYGMLELVLFYVFPELKALFVTLEHGEQHTI